MTHQLLLSKNSQLTTCSSVLLLQLIIIYFHSMSLCPTEATITPTKHVALLPAKQFRDTPNRILKSEAHTDKLFTKNWTQIDHKSCTNPLENLPLAHIKRRCLSVLTVFHLFQDEGHAADGEVGGGDGPQTCHSGVSGWDWEDTFTLVHSNTRRCRKHSTESPLQSRDENLPASLSVFYLCSLRHTAAPALHLFFCSVHSAMHRVLSNHYLYTTEPLVLITVCQGGLTTYRDRKRYLGEHTGKYVVSSSVSKFSVAITLYVLFSY